MYLTTAPGGGEFCLRPDLTIPVSRDYLASPVAGKPAGFCYLGPVFRHRSDGPAEFLQAGIESFGRPDKAAADAEMLSLGLEATAHYGLAAPDIQIGDVALFAGLVAGLDLPPAWKRRLIKDFNRKTNLAQDLDRLVLGGNNARAGISGRAGGARRLRSEGRACAGHRSVVDRRHQRGRRPLGRPRSPSASSNSRRSAPAPNCRATCAR